VASVRNRRKSSCIELYVICAQEKRGRRATDRTECAAVVEWETGLPPAYSPSFTPSNPIHAYDLGLPNKILRNLKAFPRARLHHFIYDVVVILFVFLCFLVLPSDGGSVLAECVLLVRGPPLPLEGTQSLTRFFIKYVTTLWPLIGFREAWEGGREVVACEGEAEKAEEAGNAEVDM
jgi:hypothetical protein